MRVLQCYASRFLGYYEPYRLDSLIASAIQWKSVYPEDYLVLVVTEDIKKYISLRIKTDLPWNEIQTYQGYPNHNIEFYYDYVRFLICEQQKEPFIYLDPDVFIFRELLNNSAFEKARKDVMFGKGECFVTYQRPYEFPGYYTEKLSDYPQSVQTCLKGLPVRWKLINTGFFITTPGILQKVAEKVLEVQKCFAEELGEKGYGTKIHEFASSTVPLMVLAKESISERVVESRYIHHTCGCLFPPPSCYQSCEGYFGENGGDEGEPLFSRRLVVYKKVWKKIVESGYISYSDFEKSFIRDWQDSKKGVKKGPILI